MYNQRNSIRIKEFTHLACDSKNLAPKSLGVLLYIYCELYINHNKHLTERNVIKHFSNVAGRVQIESAFKELQRKSYLTKHSIKSASHGKTSGQYKSVHWYITGIKA